MNVERRPSRSVLAVELAFLAADYGTVRVALGMIVQKSGDDAARTELIRARLARIDRNVATWHAAASRAAARSRDTGTRLFALALKAAATRAGGPQFGDGRAEMAEVERLALAADPPAAAPAIYLIALDAWQDDHHERALRLIERNLVAGVHIPESRALVGWIEIANARYAAATKHFEGALAALECSNAPDERVRASLVHALCNIASETVDLALAQRAKVAYTRVRWTDDLAITHANTLKNLLYLALLEGDLDDAWLIARHGATLVPDGPYAVIGELGAVLVSDLLGDRGVSAVQLRRAWQLLRAVRWGDADREERIALIDFATIGARAMPAEARQAILLYQSLAAKPNPLNALDHDRRWEAAAHVAAARVSEALGDELAAIEHYERACSLWESFSYRLRLAQSGSELYRLTRDRHWAERVADALKDAPSAWLISRLSAMANPYDDLRKSERRVLIELLAGKSAKAAAAAIGRSPHTVSNHTRRIFAVFGVTSRSALLARCATLGITSATIDATARPRRRAASAAREASDHRH